MQFSLPLSAFEIPDGDLIHEPGFLAPARASALFNVLKSGLDWRQDSLTIGGRSVLIPRLQVWHGDVDAVYAYSGLAMNPQPWTVELAELRDQLSARAECRFNSVLCNYYRSGQDSVAWHSDDEQELGPRPIIASLSLGGERRFLLKHKHRRDLKALEWTLGQGDLLIMRDETQRHWVHCVPKTVRDVGERINLTFRRVGNK